jgi:hypothetical protein
MKRMIQLTSCLGCVALLSFVFLSGCTPAKQAGKDAPAKAKDAADEKKPHADHAEVGPHGGPLIEWDDAYHAEFTVDHTHKTAVVFILDDKAKLAPKIDAAKITNVILTVTSVKPFVTVNLTHDAKRSDEKGIAFTSTHDFFAKATGFQGSVDGTVDGKKFGDTFTYKPTDKTKAALLREMYLKPGGIYTLADIKANGNTVPDEKFKGKIWEHADDLKIGDKVCPVTNNKAEKECAWTVQGQTYEFCCPPCLDKFIGWAHHQPERIKDTKDYVFRGM